MHEKFIKYKNYPEVRQHNHQESEKFLEFGGQLDALETNTKKKTKSTLEPLLSFHCPLTENMEVTSLDFNHSNLDLLLVGYRPRASLKSDKKGMICFWTVKNSEFPERVIHTSSGVTAVKFSRNNPFIYGVGFMDGTVAIYNMKQNQDK
jgi:WD40 repeat protein